MFPYIFTSAAGLLLGLIGLFGLLKKFVAVRKSFAREDMRQIREQRASPDKSEIDIIKNDIENLQNFMTEQRSLTKAFIPLLMVLALGVGIVALSILIKP